MKTVGMKSGLVLVALFAAEMVQAFQPGSSIVRECPRCKAHILQHTTLSGNTIGAKFRTDGKMVGPMLPDQPALVKCPKCGKLFWIDESREIRSCSPFEGDIAKMNYSEPDLPSENDYLVALSDSMVSQEKQFYLRIRAWWAANDTLLARQDSAARFSSAQIQNLQTLTALLDEGKAEDRIMRAEIFRELEKYDDCIVLLSKPLDDEDLAEVAAFIKGLALQKFHLATWIMFDEKTDSQGNERSK